MAWYETVIAAHRRVTDQVSHVQRLKSDRYFVWQEDGENSLEADGSHDECAVSGTTDLYTKLEFDPWVTAMGDAFTESGLSWYLESVQYEEDTGFWHYEWVWEVV